jgi:hypothetical protein
MLKATIKYLNFNQKSPIIRHRQLFFCYINAVYIDRYTVLKVCRLIIES